MKPYEKIAERVAIKYGLNPAVVKAVCTVESNWNTYAVRYEPGWRWFLSPAEWAKKVFTTATTEEQLQKCSWGLMQVMGTVARELGFQGEFPRLCQPELGLEYGCKKLQECLSRHPALPDALAAYNAGNPKYAAGKAYAQKVLSLV